MDVDDDLAGRVRPGPLRWLRYVFGGRLPPRHSSWVLYDVTTRTWVARHVLRSFLQFLPFALLVFVLVPVDKTVLGIGLGMGAVIGSLYSTAFVDNVSESRAMKAGYPEGHATDVRRLRVREENRDEIERYEQRWRRPPGD